MKIGVVADTHSFDLPKQMLEDFKSVDLIIHAGDFCSIKDVNLFKDIKDLVAVWGNQDEPKVRKLFPRSKILNLKGLTFGVFHGEGSPSQVLDSVRKEFADQKLDCVIFGHSHQALSKVIQGTLYFNPGSPTDTVSVDYCSYGMISILPSNRLKTSIIKIK